MKFTLRFTEPALVDFNDFVAWYFEHSPGKQAEDIVSEINEAFKFVSRYPRMRQVDDFSFSGDRELRHVTVWKFNFYYLVLDVERSLDIVGVVHQSAGPEKLRSKLAPDR